MRTTRILGIVSVAALALAACGSDDDEQSAGPDGPYVLASDDIGDDPFVADVAITAPAEFVALAPRLDDAADAVTRDDGSIDPVERAKVEATLVEELIEQGVEVEAPPTPRGVAVYGGTGINACDVGQLVEFLTTTSDKGAAFAQVHGIAVDRIPAFIATLRPGYLLLPTPTINHGFKNGGPIARPETVLEAGTAVLLDADGIPRVRCKCGNPQLPPERRQPPVVPETTAPETTAPETTAPETTASETTAPETTAPETTVPIEDQIVQQYPDRIVLEPSITEVPQAYPLGLPPAVQLDFGPPTPLTAQELDDLIVATSADRRSVTLTILEGPNAGTVFEFGDVAVPTGWRQEDIDKGTVISWRNLKAGSAETDFIAVETPVADIRHVNRITYAGYVVDSTGTMSLSFPFQGDGSGGIRGVGLELAWRGAMRCVVVNDAPVDNFDPAENCPDKNDDMFWDWGVNTVTFR